MTGRRWDGILRRHFCRAASMPTFFSSKIYHRLRFSFALGYVRKIFIVLEWHFIASPNSTIGNAESLCSDVTSQILESLLYTPKKLSNSSSHSPANSSFPWYAFILPMTPNPLSSHRLFWWCLRRSVLRTWWPSWCSKLRLSWPEWLHCRWSCTPTRRWSCRMRSLFGPLAALQ